MIANNLVIRSIAAPLDLSVNHDQVVCKDRSPPCAPLQDRVKSNSSVTFCATFHWPAKHFMEPNRLRDALNAVSRSSDFFTAVEPAKKGGHPRNDDRPLLPSQSAAPENLASPNMPTIYAQTMRILSSYALPSFYVGIRLTRE